MLNILANTNKLECSGCGACINVCPCDAIALIRDEYGFEYPRINDKLCVNCGKCGNACQKYQEGELRLPIKCFAGSNKDKQTLKESASGGVFSTLAEYVLSKSGAVCGCVYDDNLIPIHICSEKEEDAICMRKSKYVQSNVGYVYRDILTRLKKGQMVLFTGTPCQVSALYSVVGKDFSNLITIDLICHGVPSSYLFKKFIEYLESKYKTQVISFDFRSKKYGWLRYTSEFKDSKGKIKNIGKIKEFYSGVFTSGNTLRPNCFNCRFACEKRIGDITMGDFWGCETVNLKADIKNGISAFTINNPSKIDLENVLNEKMVMEEVEYSLVVKGNTCLRNPTKKGKQWEKYMQAIKDDKISTIAKQYRKENKGRILREFIRLRVPYCIIKYLKKRKATR